ncbi:hypothetical protein JCM10908_003417 [Rhodotorula pacifica]|uniref:uncharacterized protein n=1 Tax=Rhodotorula pacifica TaxID=1495444 RepID=UPI00317E5E8E
MLASAFASAAALLALLPYECKASPLSLNRRWGLDYKPNVTIKNGTVIGAYLPTFDQDAFLGVPFAQPPVGDLRLRRPRSLNATFSGGVYEATEYSPFCPGVGSDDWPYPLSENCLRLNVIRPTGTKEGDNLPVGYWIYGGGFQQGGNADQRYNASYVVQRSVEMGKPIMVVQVNYRVAALGFMSSAELKQEGNLNIGLYDQRLGLHWVQENIAQFGGNPGKVTIWGESAGAFSVSNQIFAYAESETSLFQAGILESGTSFSTAYLPISVYQARYDAVVNQTGCSSAANTLACLRALPLAAFNASASAFKWNPVVDGDLISDYPSKVVAAGNYAKVPLLIGANTDEGTAFGPKHMNTTADLKRVISASFPQMSKSSIDRILQLYPNDPRVGCPYGTGDALVSTGPLDKVSNAIYGDTYMVAGRRWLAEEMAKHKPVYSYRFNQPPDNATIETGTSHFVELAFVFGYPFPTANTLSTRPGDAELSHLMTSQWVSFIHDQTPNNNQVENGTVWPNYQNSQENYVFQRQASYIEKDDFRREPIAFLNSLGIELSH